MPVQARNTDIDFEVIVNVADPGGAGVLATGTFVFKAPWACIITGLRHVPLAAWVAAAAANDGVVVVKNLTQTKTVATLSVVTALAANSDNSMGTLSNTKFNKNDIATIDIGAALGAGTANAPASLLVITYKAQKNAR